jgi:hypothetical protein
MQTKPGIMTTLSAVMERLRVKKQDNEFKMTEQGFTAGHNKYYKPEDLTIIKTYRFEGESDPADSTILYVIEAKDGLVGYSLDAYGVYSDHDEQYDEFIRKVKVEDRDEQILFGDMENKD